VIYPSEDDIGRKVIYRGGGMIKEGEVSSFHRDSSITFVRYSTGSGGVATYNRDLE